MGKKCSYSKSRGGIEAKKNRVRGRFEANGLKFELSAGRVGIFFKLGNLIWSFILAKNDIFGNNWQFFWGKMAIFLKTGHIWGNNWPFFVNLVCKIWPFRAKKLRAFSRQPNMASRLRVSSFGPNSIPPLD